MKKKALLLAPLAMAMALPSESWFSVKAMDDSTAEVVIYDEIGGWGITARQFVQQLTEVAKGKNTISVKLHSPGGDVFEGLAIYNMLKNHPARIEVEVGGLAASMGSVIAMAGDVVRIPENAWMMVHNPWGVQGGDANEMREYADLLDKLGGSMINAYTSKSGQSVEEIKEMMAKTTWMDGNEAVALGFADETIPAMEAAASLNSQRLQDFENMPPALKALIAPQGNGNNQPPAPAPAPAPSGQHPAPAPAPTPTPAPSDAMAQFRQQEQGRRDSINTLFEGTNGEFADLQASCLNDLNCDLDGASAKLLGAMKTTIAQPSGGIVVTGGSRVEHFAGDMATAILARGGVRPEGANIEGNSFRGMHLQELARACLQQVGVNPYGMDKMEMVGMAFTHSGSDFGNILMDVAHKSLLTGYTEANETFTEWTRRGVLTDFKVSHRVGLESFPTLDTIPEGGEYKYATVGENAEQIQLATYGKMFSITRQAIINDDLHAFMEVPRLMGRAAIRTVGNLVYAILSSNPKMEDGKALFHADHKNLMTAAAMSVDALSQAETAMALQEDKSGVPLNLMPSTLIVPRASKMMASKFMNDAYDPDGNHSSDTNGVQGMAKVVSDARLDKAFKASGKAPWFLAAGNGMEPIEVAYLDGNDTPYLEQKEGFNIDGVSTKVRLDAGVKALSHRTIIKNPGA